MANDVAVKNKDICVFELGFHYTKWYCMCVRMMTVNIQSQIDWIFWNRQKATSVKLLSIWCDRYLLNKLSYNRLLQIHKSNYYKYSQKQHRTYIDNHLMFRILKDVRIAQWQEQFNICEVNQLYSTYKGNVFLNTQNTQKRFNHNKDSYIYSFVKSVELKIITVNETLLKTRNFTGVSDQVAYQSVN